MAIGESFVAALEDGALEENAILNAERSVLGAPGAFRDWGLAEHSYNPLEAEGAVGAGFNAPLERGAPGGFRAYESPSGEANLSFEREQQGLRWVKEGDQWHQYTKDSEGYWGRSSSDGGTHTSPTADSHGATHFETPVETNREVDVTWTAGNPKIEMQAVTADPVVHFAKSHPVEGTPDGELNTTQTLTRTEDMPHVQTLTRTEDMPHVQTLTRTEDMPHEQTLTRTEDMPHEQTLNRTEDMPNIPLTASTGSSTDHALTASAETQTEASGGSSKGALLGVLAVGTPLAAAGAAAAGAYLGTHGSGSDDKGPVNPPLEHRGDLLPHDPVPLHPDDQVHHQTPHDMSSMS
ncbi:hypothetical protein [Rhodoligotrophos defluvii]|uniref:hypothetical protein n=1 Tax=Rhodoligotrophos defluvii TaxID=2561934 RepID=UPI0010C9A535|nr:hypothetical protein [Rhodoligotrophos defluvii]